MTHPASLPRPRARLIGREVEIAAARDALLADDVPLLTLTGPGGSGKTRLALAIAHNVAEHFADGLFWIDLAPLADRTLVATTVAAALAVSPAAGIPITEAIIGHLRPRQLLLLLDNCEHLLPETAELIATLLTACPALQVLATSRAPLRLRGEQIFLVDPLPLPPAASAPLAMLGQNPSIRLFSERARAVAPTFVLQDTNAAAVSEICRRLDGLPLAIELAAARMKVLSSEALAAQLGDRLHLLSDGPRDAPARQKTIGDTIAWSYALLSPEEQRLFRHLAVFSGSFTLAAARAVAGEEGAGAETPILDRVAALLDQSLLRRVEQNGDPRFGMLETIRAFGLERLGERGEDDAVRDRHAGFFRAFVVDELGLNNGLPEDDTWFGRAVAEEHNLRQALAHFAARGDALALHELSGSLFDFWKYRSQFSEGRFWLEQALSYGDAVPPLVRAPVLETAAILIADHGDYAAAEPLADEAVVLAREIGDPSLLYVALQSRGVLAERQGDLSGAKVWLEESLRIARAAAPLTPDASPPVGGTLTVLGIVARRSGDTAAAAALFAEAIRELRARGRRWTLGGALGELGVLQVLAGSVAAGTASLLEGIALLWSLRDTAVLTRALRGMAAIAAVTDQPRAAAHLLGAADAIDPQTPFAVIAAWRDRDVADWTLERLREVRPAVDWEPPRVAGAALVVEQAVALARDVATKVFGTGAVEAIWSAAAAPDPGPAPPIAESRVPSPPADDLETESLLTYRERDVLALLCQRMTDAEIAERLFVSPRTVGTHVGHILAKLGAANRREAAAIAARRGLV